MMDAYCGGSVVAMVENDGAGELERDEVLLVVL
jgi:hypothetical protein